MLLDNERKKVTIEYDRHNRHWVVWYRGVGSIQHVQGRKSVIGCVDAVIMSRRKELAVSYRKCAEARRSARNALPYCRWSASGYSVRRILQRRNLAVAQGHELIALGLMPDAIHSIHYTVPRDALLAARANRTATNP